MTTAKASRVAVGLAEGSALVRWDHCCGECGGRIGIFTDRCPSCGARFDMTRPFERYRIDATGRKEASGKGGRHCNSR